VKVIPPFLLQFSAARSGGFHLEKRFLSTLFLGVIAKTLYILSTIFDNKKPPMTGGFKDIKMAECC